MNIPCDCGRKIRLPRQKCCPKAVEIDYIEIPASAGTDEPGQPLAPENGAHKNAVVRYAANNHVYIYTSEGIPVLLSEGADHPVISVNGKDGVVVLTTSDLENDSGYQTATQVAKAVAEEANLRESADNGLQSQIDAISASSDVTDIVGTYADLQNYDTSTLGDRDIIKVLQDEQHDDETTYYRWSTTTQSFTLIGEEGPYYTKSAADQKFQDKLTAGTNISIDPLTDTISASFDAETIFYANLNETGNNRHIYKNIAFTTAASAQDLIDANDVGQVILRGTSTANPTAYSDSYLQNAFIMPHNNDFEFVFLDRDLRYEYTAGATTDTVFYYSTSEIQPKLTAGTNVTITGTTISATNTTYSPFTGTDGQTAGTAGLVPAPAIADFGKFLKADGTWDVAGGAGIETLDAADWTNDDIQIDSLNPGIYKVTYTGAGTYGRILNGNKPLQSYVTKNMTSVLMVSEDRYNSPHKIGLIFSDENSSSDPKTWLWVNGYNQQRTPVLYNDQNGEVHLGQNATTGYNGQVAIGRNAEAIGAGSSITVVGEYAQSNQSRGTALGGYANANSRGGVALGAYSTSSAQGEVNVGSSDTNWGYNNTNYRVIRGVHDGEQAHDAVTLGQMNGAIGNIETILQTLNSGTGATEGESA